MRNYYLDLAEEKKAQEKLDEANRELIEEAIKTIEGLPMWAENNNTWTVNSNHHYYSHYEKKNYKTWQRSLAPFDFNSREKFRGDLSWKSTTGSIRIEE